MPNIREAVLLQVKRAAYEEMQSLVFNHSGIIYGGYVRDTIISQHYSSIYEDETSATPANNKPKAKINKFWNQAHKPATQHRCLLPADMDVTFKTMHDADAFIDTVKAVRQYSRVDVNQNHDSNYYSPLLQSIRKVCIQIVIGEIPFISYGSMVSISVDVIVPKRNIRLQAPFGNLDMLCNGFIMTKDGGISYSRNTGTVIDSYSDAKRAMVVAGIIKDMLQFKTYLCFTSRNKTSYGKNMVNLTALKRIQKMEDKTHKPWTFLNLPFKSEEYDKLDNSESCVICSSEFEKGETVAYTISHKEDGTETQTAKTHHECFIRTLKYQTSHSHSSQKWTFRCPFRNAVDFNVCQLDIASACTSYMK
jgi:hypothetical protein